MKLTGNTSLQKNLVASALQKNASNLLLTHTFFKVYGLAGLRLGWAYGPKSVIEAMNRVRGIFNGLCSATRAAIAALEDRDHVKKTVAHTLHCASGSQRNSPRSA